ncbi:hypothetical protein Syun_025395 [Stephania yunnanensis]|uniref:Transposase MuDR plant domain-containing protein n=1 Tax=Stephania yunnanensis TaxID=152371 RepID=A0AAP0ERK6_9MAGN
MHDERGESRVEGGELQVYGGELVGDEIDECERDEGDEDSEEAANDYLVGELVSDDEVVGAMSDYQIGEYSDCNESEYFESDDMGSYCSDIGSEDENRFVRRKNRRLRFDTNSDISVFCLGMIFTSMAEARQAVKKYAIKKGLGVKLVKNDKRRLRARCKEGCPWKILISMENNDETLTVKTYVHTHKCQRVEKVEVCQL